MVVSGFSLRSCCFSVVPNRSDLWPLKSTQCFLLRNIQMALDIWSFLKSALCTPEKVPSGSAVGRKADQQQPHSLCSLQTSSFSVLMLTVNLNKSSLLSSLRLHALTCFHVIGPLANCLNKQFIIEPDEFVSVFLKCHEVTNGQWLIKIGIIKSGERWRHCCCCCLSGHRFVLLVRQWKPAHKTATPQPQWLIVIPWLVEQLISWQGVKWEKFKLVPRSDLGNMRDAKKICGGLWTVGYASFHYGMYFLYVKHSGSHLPSVSAGQIHGSCPVRNCAYSTRVAARLLLSAPVSHRMTRCARTSDRC